MAVFYSGIINLSKIPKELIRENRNGEKIIYVDFAERRAPSQYGDTHYIKMYDSATRTQHYIGDFRPRTIGNDADGAIGQNTAPTAPAPAPAPMPAADNSLEPQSDDLPFIRRPE